MDIQKVDIYFAGNGKYFPAEKLHVLRDKMLAADDSRLGVILAVELKDPMVLLLISIFIGSLGVDRFMLDQIGMGLLKLFTGGLCGILWLVYIITISKKTKEYNYNAIINIL